MAPSTKWIASELGMGCAAHLYESTSVRVGACAIKRAWDGEGRVRSRRSEAVSEFDLEPAF